MENSCILSSSLSSLAVLNVRKLFLFFSSRWADVFQRRTQLKESWWYCVGECWVLLVSKCVFFFQIKHEIRQLHIFKLFYCSDFFFLFFPGSRLNRKLFNYLLNISESFYLVVSFFYAFTPLCHHGARFLFIFQTRTGLQLKDSSARTPCVTKDASQLGAQVRSVQTWGTLGLEKLSTGL